VGCFVTIAFTVSYGILSWRMRQKREDPGKRESETMRNFSDFRINILATRNASQVSNENPPLTGRPVDRAKAQVAVGPVSSRCRGSVTGCVRPFNTGTGQQGGGAFAGETELGVSRNSQPAYEISR